MISMNITIPQGFWYEEIDSTMDEAKRLIQANKINDIAFVVANSQTKGKGTHGRKWSSPAGSGIYLSVVHLSGTRKPRPYMELTTLYTQACGIACIEAIKEIAGVECKLKPVNDIYFKGKKLGGLLVESLLHKNKIAHLITGVGINLKKTRHELDRGIVEPISLEETLSEEDFKNVSKEKLIEKIVEKICFWYEEIFDGNRDLVLEQWESLKL